MEWRVVVSNLLIQEILVGRNSRQKVLWSQLFLSGAHLRILILRKLMACGHIVVYNQVIPERTIVPEAVTINHPKGVSVGENHPKMLPPTFSCLSK